ncbi:hypothetical protein [Candidatus Stoquefichus massiliensis]|uniref:hypothetical protein n=1 Tax=Candidatus Stoquefichus massiliensis TaxID=1470350 RepID=UPI000486E7D8|nr:hypothetical protein [Candidatus Stoquefichus massiliensis]
MNLFYLICRAASVGVIIGFLCGGIKMIVKKEYSLKQQIRVRKIINILSIFLKYITFLFLALGLIWCIYFLALGAFVPEDTDYANNMAELIVSVLTVISIIFAFVEYLERDNTMKHEK